MSTNYADIIGNFFPDIQMEITGGKDPSVYSNIVWKSTQISQATLDQYSNLIQSSTINSIISGVAVVNSYAYPLIQGQLVRIGSVDPLSKLPKVVLCNNDIKANLYCLGIVSSGIAANSIGDILSSGLLEGINTSTYSTGDLLYVGSNGSLTNVKPSTSFYQKIGYVYKVDVNGSIMIDIGKVEDNSNRIISYTYQDGTNPYIKKNNTSYTAISRFIFRGTNSLEMINAVKIIGWNDTGGSAAYCRLFDTTNNVVIGELSGIHNYTTPTILSFSNFTFPTTEAIVEVQIKTGNAKYCYISSLNLYS